MWESTARIPRGSSPLRRKKSGEKSGPPLTTLSWEKAWSKELYCLEDPNQMNDHGFLLELEE